MDLYHPSHTGSIWVGRFVARLMLPQPSINPVLAVQFAVTTWPYASHLEPEAAADIFSRLRGERRLRSLRTRVAEPATAPMALEPA